MKKAILNNIELKILSIIIAVTLWTLVQGQQKRDVYLNVKIETLNLPSHLQITSQSEDTVKIHLSGSKSIISRMDDRYFKPYLIDLSSVSPGEKVYKIHKTAFKVENGVRIIDISPEEVSIKVEMIVKKELPVEPAFTGKLSNGYELEGFDVLPENVRIKGPKSLVDSMNFVKTAPIDINERKRSFVRKYMLVLPARNLSIDDGKDEVVVNVIIREEQITRIIKDVPVRKMDGKGLFKNETKAINIKIAGPAGKVNDIKREEIVVQASVPEMDFTTIKQDEKIEAGIKIREIPGIKISAVNKVYFVFTGKQTK